MGTLIYGPFTEFAFEDRLLAHLERAILARLSLGQSFLLSWDGPFTGSSGRVSLWIHPSLPLQIIYAGGRQPSINDRWVEALIDVSHSQRGLVVMSEEQADDYLLHVRGKRTGATSERNPRR